MPRGGFTFTWIRGSLLAYQGTGGGYTEILDQWGSSDDNMEPTGGPRHPICITDLENGNDPLRRLPDQGGERAELHPARVLPQRLRERHLPGRLLQPDQARRDGPPDLALGQHLHQLSDGRAGARSGWPVADGYVAGVATLDWYGCATFRLRTAGLTIFLDAYIDRAPSAAGTGLTADDIDECDWIVDRPLPLRPPLTAPSGSWPAPAPR